MEVNEVPTTQHRWQACLVPAGKLVLPYPSSSETWDMVVTRRQRNRDSRQAYYTKSAPIVAYMVDRLDPSAGDTIWEPSAGEGDLLDGVVGRVPQASIRASEIDEHAASRLRQKYQDHPAVEVFCEDALTVGDGSALDERRLRFSRIIANPPYGAYQPPSRRLLLQRQFESLYVRESYGVLLYHAWSLLEANGRLVFIVPDTFLWLTRHTALRRVLVTHSTIEEIALFPSRFFPKISFGYSGLCIITISKRDPDPLHVVKVLRDFAGPSSLLDCVALPEDAWTCSRTEVLQTAMTDRGERERILRNERHGVSVSNRAGTTLGDHAEVRTGFYSGNDLRWLRKLNDAIPRSKAYESVSDDRRTELLPSLDGFDSARCFIPIVKGGAAPFVKPTHWFVDWSRQAIVEYTRTGKNPARFQNSQFYFRDGIGIPMVASSRITGALLEHRLFDQSIVGVFPHDEKLKLFVLGFFNSALATALVRQINPTVNNSANYLKRIPWVVPTQDEINIAESLVCQGIEQAKSCGSVSLELQARINAFYAQLWC